MISPAFSFWAEKTWFWATNTLLCAAVLCSSWFLYVMDDAGDYMRFFALPAYAVLAVTSIWSRVRWHRDRLDKFRLTAEFSATFILVVSLLDVFDPRSTIIEMELSGPFILLGLWSVILDEFMNLARGHVFVKEREREVADADQEGASR